ncbi:MAG: hypothetical protein ACOC44_07215 [Promethearchaeia archaeon]
MRLKNASYLRQSLKLRIIPITDRGKTAAALILNRHELGEEKRII